MNRFNPDKSQNEILLSCQQISKSFDGKTVLNRIDFAVNQGELIAILGPSGCGKSTLLRLIAGLEKADAGQIRFMQTRWSDQSTFVPPEKRDCGLVFQDLALFPHLTVQENIGFGVDSDSKSQAVAEMLRLVNLVDAGRKMIHALSGGERQRVALARSLAISPQLLLLDEPFGSLDLKLRQQMQTEVRAILKQRNVSAILVTHDQNEAFGFADRVVVMRDGKILQIGCPGDIYFRPATTDLAKFVGEANFLMLQQRQGLWFSPLGCLETWLPGETATLMLRPEDIRIEAVAEGSIGQIAEVRFQGERQLLKISLPSGDSVLASSPSRRRWQIGRTVRVTFDHGCLYDKNGNLLLCYSKPDNRYASCDDRVDLCG